MSGPAPCCGGDERRQHLRRSDRLNGIDYVEVEDDDATGEPLLVLYLQRSLSPEGELFTAQNVRIDGGPGPVPAIAGPVRWRRAPDPARDDAAAVPLDLPGDRQDYVSRCTVQLVDEEDDPAAPPIPDVDPRYRSATFFVTAGTATDRDCVPPALPARPLPPPPELGYLAKDYPTFRRLLLDRLAATVPDWRDRHSADLYLTVVEVLAYEADRLSYAQDAVSTEAYLDTARLRTSVRRHVRLVDYRMHEGCNARAWVCLTVEGDPVVELDALTFVTQPPDLAASGPVLRRDALREAGRTGFEIYETLLPTGPATVTMTDVLDGTALRRRILEDAQDPVAAYVRAAAPGLTEDPQELASALDALLHDPGLALAAGGTAAALVEAYGSLNTVAGPRLAAHNRDVLAAAFPDELTAATRLELYAAHNRIGFHTWGQVECVLPAGATSATLREDGDGQPPGADAPRPLRHLRPGHVLVLEEVLGPWSGDPADADPARRHAVRLTGVRTGTDPLLGTRVLEVTWDDGDALPFPLVLSARGPAPQCALLTDVTVACGNVVLVDHGETVRAPDPVVLTGEGRRTVTVPFAPPHDAVRAGAPELCCTPAGVGECPGQDPPYEPALGRAPVVFSEPVAPGLGATATLRQDPRLALPAVAVFTPVTRFHPAQVRYRQSLAAAGTAGDVLYERWARRVDLLGSTAGDRHFVVEVDDDGMGRLRFGDGRLGARPEPGTRPLAWYRTGGGTAGNVGDEVISQVVVDGGSFRGGRVVAVRNPMPAVGGTDPEPVDEVRLRAPHAFRTDVRRAITAEDYVTIVRRDFPDSVQQAATAIAEHGGRTVVTVRVDPLTPDRPGLTDEVREHLEAYRRIGHAVEVEPARRMVVGLSLTAHVLPGRQPGAVRAAILDRLGDRRLPDGTLGFFHPDALTFGQPIAISAVLGAVHAVPGVARATVTRLRHQDSVADLPDGDVLRIGAEEIAHLDPVAGPLEITVETTP